MTLAINDAGDVLTDAGGTWKPATRAANDAGAVLALDGGAWKPVPSAIPKQDAASREAASPAAFPAETQFNEFGASFEGDAPGASVNRVGNAAAQAWEDTPSIVGPGAQEFLDKSPVGKQIISPALKLAAGVVPGPWNPNQNAAMAGLSQAAMELFGEKGGRDLLALASSLPMIQGERMSPNVATKAAPAEAPRPQFVSERAAPNVSELDPRNAISSLLQHDIEENGTPLPGRGTAKQGIAEIGAATDVDGAITAAGRAVDAPYTPVTVSQVAARDGVGANEAYRRMVAENAAGRVPTPTAEAAAPIAAPESVGAAATPGTLTNMSFSDMKANRRVAEQGELAAPPEANDTTIYVKGSFPTLAEREGNPQTSQVENLIRQRNPGAFIGEGKRLTENNKARVAEFEEHTIPDTTLNSMRKDRQAQWVAASNDILPTAKPADLNPAANWVEAQLKNPRIQEVDAIRGVLEDFQNRLFDVDGNLKSDAAALWGMHDHLQNLLAKAKDPLNMTGAEKFAEAQILEAKKLVDEAMNVATDNRFQDALANYAESSKEINAGVLMNDFRPKLTNMNGDLQAANFHRWVLGLAKERGDPGIDPTMDISDGTMRALINIDKDLKRAGLIKMGTAAGSPTNLLGALAQSAGIDAAHSMLGSVPGIGPILKTGADFMAKRRLDALIEKHLAPPTGGYTQQGAAL